RGGYQGPGEAGRAEQPGGRALYPAGVTPPDLGGDAGPHPAKVHPAQRVIGGWDSAAFVRDTHLVPPRAARSERRARWARLLIVPAGTPSSAATSATGRSSTYPRRSRSPSGPLSAAAMSARATATSAGSRPGCGVSSSSDSVAGP